MVFITYVGIHLHHIYIYAQTSVWVMVGNVLFCSQIKITLPLLLAFVNVLSFWLFLLLLVFPFNGALCKYAVFWGFACHLKHTFSGSCSDNIFYVVFIVRTEAGM